MQKCQSDMKIDPLAAYGAVTATVAVYLQLHQWRADRAKLNIVGSITIDANRNPFLIIHAVNMGRRPVRVMPEVSIIVKASASEGFFSRLWKRQTSTRHGLGFSKSIDLAPDGGDYTWRVPLNEELTFFSETIRGEKCGKGYVSLTSGKAAFFWFPLQPLEEFWSRKTENVCEPH